MRPDPQQAKRQWRLRLRSALASISPAARHQAATSICAAIVQCPQWRNAAAVLLFSPLPQEPDVRPLLSAALADGKAVALPAFDAVLRHYVPRWVHPEINALRRGNLGILEPPANAPIAPRNQLDFLLVPGLGFTPDGRRLGRGKGYLDRLLRDVRGWKCGAAFDEQVVADLPWEPHDVQLDCIVTPSRWLLRH